MRLPVSEIIVQNDLNLSETAVVEAHNQGDIYLAIRIKERHLEKEASCTYLQKCNGHACSLPYPWARLQKKKEKKMPPCLDP